VPGLPDGITTCLFDLDGVLTQTAKVHAKAWKQMFDEFLRGWYKRAGEPYREFALPDDYQKYVDGKPRRDGVRSFLQSRAIDLPALIAAGIEDLFEARIDGIVAEREHLAGKPAPDTFLAGARALGAEPAQAAVFEDAEAGVAAGRAGRFGLVVGVDRTGHAEALREHGADIVVQALTELLEPA